MTTEARKTAIITGTGGLGFEVALALTAQSIKVILAGRNPEKGKEAVQHIQARVPEAQLRFECLDLASLDSIAQFSQRIKQQYTQIDILINNAGLLAPSKKLKTVDGFELQLGTNYLGHFVLTQQLLPLLLQSPSAQVVSVTSLAYRIKPSGELLSETEPYNAFKVYAKSKLAQLLFALELQRISNDKHWTLTSNAAHPGFAATNIFNNQTGNFSQYILNTANKYLIQPLLGQSAAEGALPIIYAATSPNANGGELYGPSGLFEMSGPPKICHIDTHVTNEETAALLWAQSEKLTGAYFPGK